MPTESTVEDMVRQIARAGWQASRTGNGELHPDDIARLAAELQSRLAPTTDQQLREENERLRAACERLLAFTSSLQEYRIYNEAKAVFAPPTEAEKGTS